MIDKSCGNILSYLLEYFILIMSNSRVHITSNTVIFLQFISQRVKKNLYLDTFIFLNIILKIRHFTYLYIPYSAYLEIVQ